ncbi:MAG: chromosomal replication initiator protein DnaA [Verrucomicrobiae bacterium]|nr:chromosomal replication initiator protein DnaA [Verrucomicrobiae bacterium]
MDTPIEKFWPEAQRILRQMLKPDIYSLWFAGLIPRSVTENEITIEVANEFCELWLRNNYLALLEDVIAHASGRALKVKFVVDSGSARVSAQGEVLQPMPEERADRAGDAGGDLSKDLGFNPNNTFETFVVGDNNSFAHGAALAVAQAPGRAYNPLFVYGGTGLGKTHLLHAIGQYVVEHRKKARVVYLTSERFTNEYIDAIQSNQLARFRRKYRQVDVLLIDDVQFLANKERIQEEFFHTFNALHEARKQIVMTCDRPAGEIQNLEHRLVSRFEWGLVTDLRPPEFETRVAILRRKEQSLGVHLPDEVINMIASRIRSNVRTLEGALIRVASYASLTKTVVTPQLAEELLRHVFTDEDRQPVTIEVIQKRVAERFDIRLADMTSKRRPENIAFPRQVAMYLARELTDSSLSVIGEAFGGRDHGTVLHAWKQVRNRMETDPNVRDIVQRLQRELQR